MDSSLPSVQCSYGSQDDSKRNWETTQIKVSARIPELHRNLTKRQKKRPVRTDKREQYRAGMLCGLSLNKQSLSKTHYLASVKK